MGITKKPSYPDYPTVTSSNPYATATTSKLGSSYTLNPFLTQQNKTIEDAVPLLYQRLANPSLDDTVSLARRSAYSKIFNEESKKSFENNLINPLSERGMLRSSLLNDLTNNLQKNQTSQLADFSNNLLSNSISDTQSLINFYMNQYANNAVFGQNTLNSSAANANSVNAYNMNAYNSALNGYGYSKQSSNDWLKYARLAVQLAGVIF